MPRAYDLLGDVTAPAEIFPRLDALAAMVETLRGHGLQEAADETAELLEEAGPSPPQCSHRLADCARSGKQWRWLPTRSPIRTKPRSG